jgi:hypothetical protein
MLKLLQTFLDIALWRKGPQDLPASRFLLMFVLAIYVLASFIQVQLLDLRLSTAFVIVGVDVVMMMLWLWLVLVFFGRRQRFIQTLTAMFGVGALLAAIDIVVAVVQIAAGQSAGEPSTLWLSLRFFAIALIMGRIFMHALDRGLLTGMALTIAIVYSTGAVAQMIVTRLQG